MFLASTEFLCRTFGSEFFQTNVAALFCAALDKPNLYLQVLYLVNRRWIADLWHVWCIYSVMVGVMLTIL